VRVLAPLALFVLSLGVRALPAQEILIEGRTFFLGYDAYYHMRRVFYSIVHFPATLVFDPYLNHPDGGQAIWTPLFDWSIAALLRPLLGILDPVQLERIAVWVPPLLGAATVVATYFLALRFFGVTVALISAGTLSVLSGHFWYSQIGFIDHHAAVALVATIILAAGMTLLAVDSAPAASRRSAWPSILGTGAAYGVALLLWPGMLLHVGLVEIALLSHLLGLSRRDPAIEFAGRLAVVHAVAFALLFPFGATSHWGEWGRFSPVVLSAFQPWYFGAATLFCLFCHGCWRLEVGSRTRPGRFATAFGIAAILLGASAWLFPSLAAAFGDAWEWFAKQDSFQAQVAESKPLFQSRDGFTLNVAVLRLSTFSLLVPIALAIGFATVHRRPDRSAIRLFLWWSLGLCFVTIFQRRFFNSASVAVSMLFALSLTGVYARLPATVRDRTWKRRIAKAALVVAGVFLLLPTLATYRDYLEKVAAGLRGEVSSGSLETRKKFAMVQMANWIRSNTPEPSAWLDAESRPAYGILAPWTLGHVLEYEARRPTVTTNFGDDIGRKNFLLARRYYQSEEAPAAEILDRLRVRYVIAQQVPNYLGEKPLPNSMFFSLYRDDGAGFEGAAGDRGNPALPALERHRFIYESPPLLRTEPPSASMFKVFEYVPGARVVGRAAPGARIHATLSLRSNRRRGIDYVAEAITSRSGEYVFRFPYANSGSPGAVKVGATYRFECRGDVGSVAIDEAAVMSGGTLPGPDLCLSGRK
jgi:asparagine N-glycosylation enzyme membrane subunit Stt3